MSKYSGFYKKSIDERIDILADDERFDRAYLEALDPKTAAHMVENVIDVFEVPLGVAPGFLIDGDIFHAAMATEESSVVAAASHGAKIIAKNGGFKTTQTKRLMRGEIAFPNPVNLKKLKTYIQDHEETLHDVSNKAHPSIVNRGGGVKEFQTRTLYDERNTFFILDVLMDTQEAMGANMMNTVLESLAQHLEEKTSEKALIAILSNLTTESMVHAQCKIKVNDLKYGEKTAQNIVLASELSKLDVYRCATHNKGVMNGIEAVVLASGNDTRAVSAGIYTYTSMSHKVKPLTFWYLDEEYLVGEIEIPLALGSVGGAISVHPKAKLSKSIMGYDNVYDLNRITASVGLAQNFAALYALTTDGIQKGHMALHAKNIAKSAGASDDILDKVTKLLRQEKTINIETAKAIIQKVLNENA